MKYLKTKNSRRRGIAMELAIFVIMLCFGLSIIILTTSMIQKNNYNRVVKEHTLKLELERIGSEFCVAVKNKELEYFEWKISQETAYKITISEDTNEKTITLTINDEENVSSLFIAVLKEKPETDPEKPDYEIIGWELK